MCTKLDCPWTGTTASLSAHISSDADAASGRAFPAGFSVTHDRNEVNRRGDPRPRFQRRDGAGTFLAISQYMLQTIVSLVNDERCETALGPYGQQIEVCNGFLHGGRDGCQGDSGGRLITPTSTGEPYLIDTYATEQMASAEAGVNLGWGAASVGYTIRK